MLSLRATDLDFERIKAFAEILPSYGKLEALELSRNVMSFKGKEFLPIVEAMSKLSRSFLCVVDEPLGGEKEFKKVI